MDVKFINVQFSQEQAEFLALCQTYYKKIKFHIDEGLWDCDEKTKKWAGSYTVNLKPDTGEIEDAVTHRYSYPKI